MKRILTIYLVSSVIISMISCSEVSDSSGSEEYAAVMAEADYELKSSDDSVKEAVTESQTEQMTEETVTIERSTESSTEPVQMPEEYVLSGNCRLDVEVILQNPELPTGCEVTALAIALNYCGFEIGKVELCDNFLFNDLHGIYTFNEAFIGDPKADNGFGCYAPVITETAEKYFDSVGADWQALNITGSEFTELFYQIEKGRPVIVWASMGLVNVTMRYRWTTADGDEAWFADNEHCMVLTGYDQSNGVVYVADPLNGNVEYSLERFESVYNQMEKQAVILYEQGNKT